LCCRSSCSAAAALSRRPPRAVSAPPTAPTTPPTTYCDQKVANRDTKVWHFVIEKGY
jgi:hypothetical protein